MVEQRHPGYSPRAALPVGHQLVDSVDFKRLPKVLLHRTILPSVAILFAELNARASAGEFTPPTSP